MRAIFLGPQPDTDYPLIDQLSILAGANVSSGIGPALKDKIIHRPATALQPCEHASPGRLQNLELDWSPSLLLHDHGT